MKNEASRPSQKSSLYCEHKRDEASRTESCDIAIQSVADETRLAFAQNLALNLDLKDLSSIKYRSEALETPVPADA